jgi:pyruvate dehydrogenase E2 component (dihydrolipoamide acetyltransferase)
VIGVRQEFRLPDVGEGLTEAEIVGWQVAAGDTVTVNQVLVEIETAKAVVELPSPFAGTVGELLAQPGATVQVGTPIIAIETAGGPAPGEEADAGAKIGEAGKDGRIATLVGYGPRQGTARRRPRRGGGAATRSSSAPPAPPAPPGEPAAARSTTAPNGSAHPNGERVPLATPPVRKLAKDLGVDLRSLAGSGATGAITRDDVRAAASAPAEQAVPAGGTTAGAPAPGRGGSRREPIRGVRKATAAAMVSSAFTAPHVTEFLAVDVTATMALRDRLRGTRAYAEVKLTPLAFVAKAVCLAARRTPEVNASWDEAAGEIVYYDHVQLGIAAATPRGLIVPKIRDADTLDLAGLAGALGELTATARSGKTPPADLANGTFTITNVGVFGVDTGTPILPPGEAAILALGTIREAPWVHKGKVKVRQVTTLGLSFDHRIIDGELGAKFLRDVGAFLTDPEAALLAWG